ncbi:oxidoreductase [Patulibacter medicamentivorans]|uniref:Oxidoreductase n=1 Tax=Patulibacter medicamentivorans TaxID=1097667 RepID=H0E3U2_9ACTN|nr:D-arabinono-1,4-lactone oxidase [Patulibacter medicamentivorans]EHN11661.1 oxidoreductase [Patulibacter medicamentivorans]
MAISGTTFTNWAGTERCTPARIVRARTIPEVQEAVRRAAADGLPVKAAGSGHSFTAAAMTDGVLVDISGLDRVLDIDRERRLVRVEAGIAIHALADALASHGLAFENLGDIDRQSIAGAIATGTHGTGGTLGNISSQVVGAELVDGRGELVALDGVDDPDGLRAARVSLGALGIVVAVTLRCVPAYVLRGVDTTAPLEEVLESVDQRVADHRHFELYAFPHAPRALTRTNDVVDEPAAPPGRLEQWLRQGLLETYTLKAFCGAGKRVPRAIPRLNRAVTRLAGTSVRTDRSDRIFSSPRDVRFVEMEYALPRAATVPALREILATIDRRGFAVNFPIEVRFVAGDDALLSPARGRETGYLAVHMYRGMPWEPYFRAVEAIANEHGGRPHWGKRHFQTAATLAPRYPEFERFAAVRARLDPDGRFANAYTDQVLGPARPVGSTAAAVAR